MSDFPILASPVQLQPHHKIDDWLKRRARSNAANFASKTYVVTVKDSDRVIGYFCLSMGQVVSREALGSMRRNMPEQIPSVVLGRLAIDEQWQGSGVGSKLLREAIRLSNIAADYVSARLVMVHAISDDAVAFYEHFGFKRLPVESQTLALDLKRLAALDS